MSWRISLDGMEITSDEFLLADLEDIEKTTGTSWALLNPFVSLPVARAFLAVLLRRNGLDDTKIADRLQAMTLAELKTCFTWEGEIPEGDQVPKSRTPGQSSPGSSPGAAGASGGHRKKRADSGSEIS